MKRHATSWVVFWEKFLREISTCNSAQQQRNWQWRFEMRACPFSAMVQIHGCATKVEEVSTFHETWDAKIAILTFLSQANIHFITSWALRWNDLTFCWRTNVIIWATIWENVPQTKKIQKWSVIIICDKKSDNTSLSCHLAKFDSNMISLSG